MEGSESTPSFSNIAEIAEAAKGMDDLDEMIAFVEQENSKLCSPIPSELLDKITHDISKEITDRLNRFDPVRCLNELKSIKPGVEESERVKQALDFVKKDILSKNGDVTEQILFIEAKVFDYFGIPTTKRSPYGKAFREGYENLVKAKRKKQSKRELSELSSVGSIVKIPEIIESGESHEHLKIYRVSPEDIVEYLKVPYYPPEVYVAGKHHIKALWLMHLKGQDDVFGNPEYNTANFRARNDGLFYYEPEPVTVKDDENKSHFDHWNFTEVELSPTPITVMDSARNIDSDYGEILYTLEVKNEYGGVNVFTERKKTLFTKNGILDLINKNFCVPDADNKKLNLFQEYFKRLIYDNAGVIPRTLAAESTGWKEAGKYFVIGSKAYSKDGVLDIHMLDTYTEQVYKPKGDSEKYFSGIKEVVEKFPIAQFMIYASCASPLLYLLGLDSVVVFLRGDSTTGKTRLCKLAVSPFYYLMKIAESTKAYQELDTAQNDGLPTFYDEASGNEDRLNKIIYMISGGTGKGRANEFGKGVNHGKTWKTVVIYNGENPILTQADNVGKFVRVIEIRNPVEKSPDNKVLMDKIEETCSENHGWLADPFFKEVFRRKADIPVMYENNLKRFGKCNDAGERLKRYFAAFATAGEILEDIFAGNEIETPPAFDIVNNFFQEVVLGRPIEDEFRRALKIVMNWIVSNEGTKVINTLSLETPEVKPAEVWAWITEPQSGELRVSASDRICFVPAKLRKLLEEHGFNPDKIIEAWAGHGIVDSWVRKEKDGNEYGRHVTELKKKVNGRTITAIKIIYDNAQVELGWKEAPGIMMPEKYPVQELMARLKTHARNRSEMGIEDTKETLLTSFLEKCMGVFSSEDVEFAINTLRYAGWLNEMPSA